MCGLPSKTFAFQDPTPAIIPASGKVLFNASNRGVMTRRSPMSLLRSTKIFSGAIGGFHPLGKNKLNAPTRDSRMLLRQPTYFLPYAQDSAGAKRGRFDLEPRMPNPVEMLISNFSQKPEDIGGGPAKGNGPMLFDL